MTPYARCETRARARWRHSSVSCGAPKLRIAGSNPVSRSILSLFGTGAGKHMASTRSEVDSPRRSTQQGRALRPREGIVGNRGLGRLRQPWGATATCDGPSHRPGEGTPRASKWGPAPVRLGPHASARRGKFPIVAAGGSPEIHHPRGAKFWLARSRVGSSVRACEAPLPGEDRRRGGSGGTGLLGRRPRGRGRACPPLAARQQRDQSMPDLPYSRCRAFRNWRNRSELGDHG